MWHTPDLTLARNLPPASILAISLFWGFLIFNLERLILISNTNDKNSFTQKLAFSLRICIAIILGLLLSEPLKLRMFRGDIEKLAQNELPIKREVYNKLVKAEEEKDPRRAEITKLLETRSYFEALANCETQNAKNQAAGTRQYSECDSEIKPPPGITPADKTPQSLFTREEKKEAIRKNSGVAVDGPIARRSRDLASHWERKVADFDSSLLQGQRLESLQIEVQQEATKNRALFEKSLTTMTPLESYSYMSQLAERNWGVGFLSLVVTIAFVLIDLIVLVAKLSFGKSIYDYRVESLEGVIKTIEDRFKSLTSDVVDGKFNTTINGSPQSVEQLVDDALIDYTNAVGSAYRTKRYEKLKLTFMQRMVGTPDDERNCGCAGA